MHYHRAFDKVVASRHRLRLLPVSPPAEPDVEISWSDEALEVDPAPGLLIWHRGDAGYIVDAPASKILVTVDRTGTRLVVHPNSREVDLADYGLPSIPASLLGTPRLAADTIVTNVLTSLPALWGQTSVHGAALATPEGVVMLCARSGWGKSTVSQWLARRGWELLDDDSASVELMGNELRIVPMGALARLRADAAEGLGMHGERLPGYAGGKQAFDPGSSRPHQQLAATVHLVQLREDAEAPAVQVAPVAEAQALVSLSRSMHKIDPLDDQARDKRVRTAQHLALAPAYSVLYRRNAISPAGVADAIQQAVTGQCTRRSLGHALSR